MEIFVTIPKTFLLQLVLIKFDGFLLFIMDEVYAPVHSVQVVYTLIMYELLK